MEALEYTNSNTNSMAKDMLSVNTVTKYGFKKLIRTPSLSQLAHFIHVFPPKSDL